jgi:cytochrome P450
MESRVQEITDELLDRVADNNEADLIHDLAYELPLTVINELIGVPAEARPLVRKWSHGISLRLEPGMIGEVHHSILEFRAYIGTLIDARRGRPGTDLVAALLVAEERGEKLTEEQLFAMLVHLLFAGHETTANLIGNCLYLLLSHREQWDWILEDDSRAAGAVEEALRYEPPAAGIDRRAKSEIQLAGVLIPRDTTVHLSIAAANRDPRQYADPDVFDISRDTGRLVSFGLGPHYCIGASLARLEANLVLKTLVRRFPDLHLIGDPPSWNANRRLRGLHSLPVRFRPA